jgi:hypothetical protein
LFVCFGWYWGLNSGLALTTQALYHLSHTSALFCFSYFLDRVLRFCPWLASDHSPPTYTSHLSRTTAQITMPGLLIEMGGLTNFSPGLASNHDPPPISTSQVAEIISGSHCTQPQAESFFLEFMLFYSYVEEWALNESQNGTFNSFSFNNLFNNNPPFNSSF